MVVPANGPAAEKPAVPPGIVVRVFARTDVGLLREHNEDDFLVADLTRGARALLPDVQTHAVGPGGSLFVVCDGMGGAAAGEVASRTAVDTIYDRLRQAGPPASWDELVSRLDHAIIEAGKRIYAMARSDQERRGMGTTCTAAALFDARLFVAQVGDSRCYVLRGGAFRQVTRDQSLLTQLIEAGQVKPEDAPNFEHSNIILQALGTTEMVNTDVTYVDLRRGDTILLCSDGLSGMVGDDAIRECLVAHAEPLVACRTLTEMANKGGGEDNITVVVASFGGQGLPEAQPEEPVSFQRYPKPRPTQFDRVPYTIPNQTFADGGSAVPSTPEVPMGAVQIAGMQAETPAGAPPPAPAAAPAEAALPTPAAGPVEPQPAQPAPAPAAPAEAEVPPARGSFPPPTTPSAAPGEKAAKAHVTDFDGTGSNLAEALRGVAENPRVIEWSDEDVPLDDLPEEPPAAGSRRSLRGWTIGALLVAAAIVALLVAESLRSPGSPPGASGTPPPRPDAATTAPPGRDAAGAPPDADADAADGRPVVRLRAPRATTSEGRPVPGMASPEWLKPRQPGRRERTPRSADVVGPP